MASPRSQETWDCMLPGPPSRSNGGSADCSPSGLLAYGAGSSVVVADPRSMQLVSVLPMPPPHHHHSSSSGGAASSSSASPHALAPFVTSVRWSPQPFSRDLSALDDASNSHLRLAVGDRQGRIALWDFRSRQVLLWLDLDSAADRSRLGIQDLCWVRSDSWLLVSIHGPSLLALWNAASGRCIWKYDAAPEYLSCIRRDPFDSRHFCTLGLRGFLLSAIALGGGAGGGDGDVSIQEHQVSGIGDLSDLQKIEREAGGASPSSPALALFPLFFARLCFSPRWRHILLISFPKEFIVFDLQYGASLSSTPLPRGCGKFLDLVPDPDLDLLYCAHLDGKLSIWKRKEGEQVHVLCTMEELMPSIGTAVPSPAILAITLCQSESAIQNVIRLCSESLYTHSSLDLDYASHKGLYKEMDFGSKSHLISISDDGKIWNWLLTSDKARDAQKAAFNMNKSNMAGEEMVSKTCTRSTDNLLYRAVPDADKEPEPVSGSCVHLTNSSFIASEFSMKISLTGQLHLLSSTVTTLAIPSPSLIATLARGGNNPAPAVPLVALGTQSGTIDVIDVSANVVAGSFSVHSGIIRGLKWLGNSRLVSFSYSQVNDKGGGYNNRLVITCLRSGLNRTFRVLQKPERAPIRALRASSSGRYILILFRDAPVEVWAMTKNPIMDTSDPLANALLQPQSPGTLVLELDWLPTRTNKNEPLVLCIAGADSSFRLIEVNINDAKSNSSFKASVLKERFRPMPLCLPVLLPTAHALVRNMQHLQTVYCMAFDLLILDEMVGMHQFYPLVTASVQDLRNYMIDSTLPAVGDSVVPELLLKVLEPYRKEVFGEFSEALFWLQLPQALCHSVDKSENRSLQEVSKSSVSEAESLTILNRIASRERSVPGRATKDTVNCGQLNFMAFKQVELWGNANERIPWHEKLDGEEAIQKRVHELVSVGDLEAAVSLLLSTPPEGSQFYPNALRAVALSSAVSRSLHELAVKVIAANMVRTDKSLSGTHLLCAVGRYQEACSQLQDAGCWTDAATLAATHLHGSDYARVLQRWADYILYNEHNIWRALILYVAAGALPEALSALRNVQQPDTAAMFLLACHEINAQIASKSRPLDEQLESSLQMKQKFHMPSRNLEDEDLIAVSEYYGQYQRNLVHLCMDAAPLFD
ncbi:hypothetical protein COCNU_06G000270 [Cocos nucifera]|uniref:WD repeat-containing protein 11 n=1 Tax=Cocos nucifera TaxID=13894 RepID=A0A8K0I9C2_COCNU|nr:hypothetical protein COCNU_06G000270 [Cocos nucifera]